MKPSKKEQRRLAIEEEKRRRFTVAAQRCPVTREEYESLFEHVADHIVEKGHKHDFSVTADYLKAHAMPMDSFLAFLSEHHISDDWSLFIGGDPHRLFGPTAERFVRMPIEEHALRELLNWMDARVAASGCDHTHKLTREWLSAHRQPETKVIGALMAQGGGCDCEVALNIEPETIYPKTCSLRTH